MFRSGIKLVLSGIVALTVVTPVLAQDFSPEPADNSLSQVDITSGMAEQSAMHAVRNGYAPMPVMPPPQYQGSPQQPLQGFAAAQAPAPSFQGAAQGYNNGQNYAQPMNGQTQNFNNNFNSAPQNQQCQQFQGCAQQNDNNNYGNGPSQNSGMGITTQMVGVMGAALLFNYATTGGMANVMGEMHSRGYGGRFHTLGSCVGGNVFH